MAWSYLAAGSGEAGRALPFSALQQRLGRFEMASRGTLFLAALGLLDLAWHVGIPAVAVTGGEPRAGSPRDGLPDELAHDLNGTGVACEELLGIIEVRVGHGDE